MHFIPRFFTPPQASYFLFGPRGVGKSTWLKKTYPEAIWIDLLEPDQLRYYSAKPERLRQFLAAHPGKNQAIIDEIQKVPELLSLVHAIIEEKKGYQFILTGSSARKLKRSGVDLLAGRALLRKMHPFLASELGESFSIDRVLKIGLVPLIWEADDADAVLKTYAALYLKEEVQAEGLVRNVGDFARFLEVISLSHGALLNTNNIARECSVSRKTVENYLQILEDLLLSFTLTVFTKRAQRVLSSHPKFYLFDCGVYRSLRPTGPLDCSTEVNGAGLEGLVAQHLRAWIDEQAEPYELTFWRTRSGLEVDFIVYGAKGLWAIEVKNKETLSPQDLNGLAAFKSDYPEAMCLMLYRGRMRIEQKGIRCIPCEEFLQHLRPDILIGKNLS